MRNRIQLWFIAVATGLIVEAYFTYSVDDSGTVDVLKAS